MNRRRLLQLGACTGLALSCAAGTLTVLKPTLAPLGSAIDAPARACFAALANVLLDGSLPTEAAARRDAIERHLQRMQRVVAGLPQHVRAELAELMRVLDTRIGRWAVMGVGTSWADIAPAELVVALDGMRRSSFSLRMQAYLALRELTMAAYFAEPATWSALGYPGPVAV